MAHNALSRTAPTQLSTPCESHCVLNHLGELPGFSQPLHCPHEPITPIAYPTMAMPATLNHLYATNHTRPPHIVNGPRATPITPLPGVIEPPWRFRSSDHHLRDSKHLTTTYAVPRSFRAAEQHAHRHGRTCNRLHDLTVSSTNQHRWPCPVQQLVRLRRRPITLIISVS